LEVLEARRLLSAQLQLTSLTLPAAVEGVATSTATLAVFSGPSSQAGSYTANVDWGDGNTDTLTAANGGIVANADGSFSVLDGHTYAEEGNPTFTVSVADSTGDSTSTSGTLPVSDAPLLITAYFPPPKETMEGSPTGPLTLATFTDTNPHPQASDFTATVTWGDGSTDTLTVANGGIVANADGSFSVVGGHTFGSAGGLDFSVSVADAGGASDTRSSGVSISDAPLNLFGLSVPAQGLALEEGSFTGTVTLISFADGNPLASATDFTAVVAWGDGSQSTLTAANGGIVANQDGTFSVVGSHTYTDEVFNGQFFVTVQDADGASASQSTTVNVADAPLSGVAFNPPPFDCQPGAIIGSSDLLTFADPNPFAIPNDFTAQITWPDGTTDTVFGSDGYIPANGDGTFSVQDFHTCTGAGNSDFSVKVFDRGGETLEEVASNPNVISPLVLFSFNPPPTMLAEGNNTGLQNLATFFYFTPFGVVPPPNFSAVVDWGDGTIDSFSIPFVGDGAYSVLDSHTYTTPGSATFSVTISDSNGDVVGDSSNVVVVDVPLTITSFQPPRGLSEGASTGNFVLASFTDDTPVANLSAYTATVQWGDGTSNTLTATNGGIIQNADGSFSLVAGHTYTSDVAAGLFSVSVSDVPIANASQSASIVIPDAPLDRVALNLPVGLVEGQPTGLLVLGTFRDFNPYATPADFTAVIDWSDGSSATLTAANGGIVDNHDGTFSVVAGHTPLEEGTGIFTGTLADGGQVVAALSAPVTTADAPLTLTTLTPPASYEGVATGTQTLATFTDASIYADIGDFTALVDWGDGSTSTLTAAGGGIMANATGGFAIVGDHTYAEEGSYTLAVQIADLGGFSTSTSSTFKVADAPLAITALNPPNPVATVNTGPLTVATFTDANANPDINDFTATVSWGDGSTDALTAANGGLVANGDGTFSVIAAHTYATETPNLTFAITVTDAGGATASTSTSFPGVAYAVDIRTFTPALTVTEGQPTGTLTLATFTDANASVGIGDFTAVVDWGDSHSDTLTAANGGIVANGDGTYSVLASHTYAEEAQGLTLTVTVTDPSGGPSQSTSVDVSDAALAVQTFTPPSAIEGVNTGTLTLATFSDANTSPDPADYTATVSWGDGTSDTLTSASGGIVANSDGSFSVVGSHTYGEEGSGLAVSVQVSDAGGSATSTSATIGVADAPLSVTQLTAPNATEGVGTGTLTLANFTDANLSPDITDLSATASWGDGHSDTLTSANGGLVQNADGSFSVVGSHTYSEDGSGLALSVQITDKGGSSTSTSATINVADAALAVQTLTPPAATEGVSAGTLTLATFTDANTSPDINDYTATVTWGDSHSDTLTAANGGIVASGNGFAVQAGHTYGEEGSGLTFSVQVSDAGGASTSTSATINVADAALTVTNFSSPSGAVAGVNTGTLTLATFTDANTSPDSKDFTATVNWGDNTSDTLTNANGGIVANADGSFSVLDSHTYAQPLSNATFCVQLSDAGGASSSTSASINVAPGGLNVTGQTFSATENAAVSNVTVATFTDPAATSFSATITWGDNDTTAGVHIVADPNVAGQYDVVASKGHPYAEGGSYSVGVTVGDNNNASASVTSTAAVADLPITASGGLLLKAIEGASFKATTVATFTDADTSEAITSYTATIDWGDNTTSAGIVKSTSTMGKFLVQGGHRYADEGNYTVTTSISDSGGATATATATAAVADAALTPTAKKVSPTEGVAFTGTVATFHDNYTKAPASDFTATILWGDGNTSTGTVVATGKGNFAVVGSNTYAEEGSYAVNLSISDDGGSSTSVTSKAVVADARLTAKGLTLQATEGNVFSGTVATFTDGSANPDINDLSATIVWGDKQTSVGTIVSDGNGGFAVLGSHTYAEKGTYSMTVTINDAGGASSKVGSTAKVADAPLSGQAVTVNAVHGQPFSGTVATLTDGNPTAPVGDFTATINWGDGTKATTATVVIDPNGGFDVIGDHTYTNAGAFAITVNIIDKDGSTLTLKGTAYVT
jgi:hypothetical protein